MNMVEALNSKKGANAYREKWDADKYIFKSKTFVYVVEGGFMGRYKPTNEDIEDENWKVA